MLNWFRSRSSVPVVSEDNPGQGVAFRAAFSDATRTWEEEVNLLDSLEAVTRSRGLKAQRHSAWLELESGIVVQPQIVAYETHESGGVKTATTIQASHKNLIPAGLFEYQHAVGDDLRSAIAQGFENWAQLDLVVLTDALREQLENCTSLAIDYPKNALRKALKRRVVLGPASHLAKKPTAEDEEHPFCPCCLFTNSFDAFRDFLESDSFHGIRLFVMRDENGAAQADCRVNGTDWEVGAEALIKYAQGWPDRGFEFRKQYVAIQSVG